MSNFYKLVYIKGISRLDTWKFGSKSNQKAYFDSLTGYRVDDYFPPHYTNTIRFDINDFNYSTTNYNYCLLYFNNKYYCYFIDGIHYLNEDVFELMFVEDTIQTHMFDVSFNYSVMDRMSIKRKLANGEINRDYIRENLSQGEFVNSRYEEYSRYKYVLITSRQELHTPSGYGARALVQNSVDMTSGLYRYLLCLPDLTGETRTIYGYKIEYDGGTGSLVQKTFYYHSIRNVYNYISESEDVVDCIFIDNCKALDEYLGREDSVIQENNVYYYLIQLTKTDNMQLSFDGHLDTFDFVPCLTITKNNFGDFQNELFVRIGTTNLSNQAVNTHIDTPFDIKYVPALLDENYINLRFGEKMKHSTYPLYKSKIDRFYQYEYYDFASYSRIYMINAYNTNPATRLEDVYDTKILCNTIEYLEKYTDAWQQFKSQNYATLTSGIKNNMALDLAGTFLGSVKSSTTFTDEGAFSKTTISDPKLTAAKAGIQVAKTLNDFLTTKGNLEHTPDKRNMGNNYSSDFLSRATKVFQAVDYVKDIEQVAKKLEWYGYKVNYNYTNTNILLDSTVQPRYYFNIIKCSSISIDMVGFIKDNVILDDIETRLKNGLRIWDYNHQNTMLDNLIYDNVENDYISA